MSSPSPILRELPGTEDALRAGDERRFVVRRCREDQQVKLAIIERTEDSLFDPRPAAFVGEIGEALRRASREGEALHAGRIGLIAIGARYLVDQVLDRV